MKSIQKSNAQKLISSIQQLNDDVNRIIQIGGATHTPFKQIKELVDFYAEKEQQQEAIRLNVSNDKAQLNLLDFCSFVDKKIEDKAGTNNDNIIA